MQEVDLGIVPDLGTLQRLPKIVGNDSIVRELCYTARQMNADEARSLGLVRFVFTCCAIKSSEFTNQKLYNRITCRILKNVFDVESKAAWAYTTLYRNC